MKKILKKKTYDYIEVLGSIFLAAPIIFLFLYSFSLIFFKSFINNLFSPSSAEIIFFSIGSLFLGISFLSILKFFFTSKEYEEEILRKKNLKMAKTKVVKKPEYYMLRFLGYIFAIIAIFFIISLGGDEWATNIFQSEKVRTPFIIIPALLSAVCFNNAKKFKKKGQ